MKRSGKSGLRGYGHALGGRIFITLFPAYAGVIPHSVQCGMMLDNRIASGPAFGITRRLEVALGKERKICT